MNAKTNTPEELVAEIIRDLSFDTFAKEYLESDRKGPRRRRIVFLISRQIKKSCNWELYERFVAAAALVTDL